MKKWMLLVASLLSVSAYAEYAIYAQVSSTIIWLAQPGQTLKTGEILVKLDARLAESKLAQARAILAIRRIEFDDKKLVFTQIKQLFDNLVRSKRELDIANIDYQQAKYQFEAQKNLVEQQKLWLEKHQILAPFDLRVESISTPRNSTNQQHPKPLLLVAPIKNKSN